MGCRCNNRSKRPNINDKSRNLRSPIGEVKTFIWKIDGQQFEVLQEAIDYQNNHPGTTIERVVV